MTAAAAAETRMNHRATRVRAALALAPRSLSCQVRDMKDHNSSYRVNEITRKKSDREDRSDKGSSAKKE